METSPQYPGNVEKQKHTLKLRILKLTLDESAMANWQPVLNGFFNFSHYYILSILVS